jgi:hypothetical protein
MDLITWHWIMGHSVCLSWNSVFGVHLTTAVLYFFLASIHLFKLLTISYSVMIQEHCCWYIHCMVLTCTLCYLSILSVSWPNIYVVYRWQELWDRCWNQMDLHFDRLVQLSKSSLQLSGYKVFAKFKNCNCWTWFNMVPVFLHLICGSCSGIFHISRGGSTV